jgi:hypothetical protein
MIFFIVVVQAVHSLVRLSIHETLDITINVVKNRDMQNDTA